MVSPHLNIALDSLDTTLGFSSSACFFFPQQRHGSTFSRIYDSQNVRVVFVHTMTDMMPAIISLCHVWGFVLSMCYPSKRECLEREKIKGTPTAWVFCTESVSNRLWPLGVRLKYYRKINHSIVVHQRVGDLFTSSFSASSWESASVSNMYCWITPMLELATLSIVD